MPVVTRRLLDEMEQHPSEREVTPVGGRSATDSSSRLAAWETTWAGSLTGIPIPALQFLRAAGWWQCETPSRGRPPESTIQGSRTCRPKNALHHRVLLDQGQVVEEAPRVRVDGGWTRAISSRVSPSVFDSRVWALVVEVSRQEISSELAGSGWTLPSSFASPHSGRGLAAWVTPRRPSAQDGGGPGHQPAGDGPNSSARSRGFNALPAGLREWLSLEPEPGRHARSWPGVPSRTGPNSSAPTSSPRRRTTTAPAILPRAPVGTPITAQGHRPGCSNRAASTSTQ